ncbi:hypothetical protein Val02_37470 [Virgisporangium aliadipatigenens]|uniref:Glycosyltransferase 2-like domain-containing protein n=1 Tax=Virgisporangium aliadipatigenens TaxID=741659 RepID=A0A8J3YKH7_9ACTN|nr:glycosyltransferase [Virgisporangium aliadipatigenens]GIJ46861.1 hypothetical protein Val02_37470 [Virgisporangium aliadipatigenens]
MTGLDIVLPCYGNIELLKAAVRSVLSQKSDQWHLTVIDDGQDPELPTWFASLGHPRVRYERNEKNLGITANFQKCLDSVKREHMVMMGSDDIMLPNYVDTILDLLNRHPDATIIHPGVQIVDESGKPVRTLVDHAKQRIYRPSFHGEVVLAGESLAASLLRGNWFYFPSLCWRTSALASVGFDRRFVVIQDLAAALPLIAAGGTMVVSETLSFQYRRHSNSVSSAEAIKGSRFPEERSYFREAAKQMEQVGWKRAARAARWHDSSRLHALALLPSALRKGQLGGARGLLEHALRPLGR